MAGGRGMVLVSLFVSSVLLGSAVAVYLPGMCAGDYQEGAKVEIYADNLESTKNQFPYEYFSVAFCEPAEKVRRVDERPRCTPLQRENRKDELEGGRGSANVDDSFGGGEWCLHVLLFGGIPGSLQAVAS